MSNDHPSPADVSCRGADQTGISDVETPLRGGVGSGEHTFTSSLMSESSTLSRRTALKTLTTTGALTALAGCSGGTSGGGSSEETTEATTTQAPSDIIQAVEPDGYNLVVQLAEAEPIDSLGLISAEGNSISETDVSAGETQASVSLSGYSPGPHDVVAARDGEVIDRLEIDLQPEFEIAELGHTSSNRDELPDFGDTYPGIEVPYGRVWLVIRNTGDITIRLSDVTFQDSQTTEEDPDPDIGLRNNNGASPRTIEPGESYPYASQRVGVLVERLMCESADGTLSVEITTESGATTSGVWQYTRTEDVVAEELSGEICRTTIEERLE